MINHAALRWNEQGAPVSERFDDVYFSKENGLEETHYVFLEGNELPTRLITHSRPLFIVAETGFGTGLNFLTLWRYFIRVREQNPDTQVKRLHFISCEKYPLSHRDLARAHQQWPQLALFSRELQAQWPEPIPGCHRLLFAEGQITLDLWFGDIANLLEQFDESLDQQVDAWFLDGFAPAKNPEMWSESLFNTMARLSRNDGTLATFTAAGFVRRGLQQAGFTLSRRKGYGPKREMLVGQRQPSQPTPSFAPWYKRPAAKGQDIAIIGGGIASACLALALARRDYQVTVYSAHSAPAANASGNRQAAVYPLLMGQDPAIAELFPSAFSFAYRWYKSLDLDCEQQWQGVLQLGWNEKSQKKIAQMLSLGLPTSLARAVADTEANEIAGIPLNKGGIFYPKAGWIAPGPLTDELFARAEALGIRCFWQHPVAELIQQGETWQLTFADAHTHSHQNIILANGDTLNQFKQTAELPIYPVAGQVSHAASSAQLAGLKTVLCYDGYLTPLSAQYKTHSIGASYRRNSRDRQFLLAEQQQNRQRLIDCLPQADWAKTINTQHQDGRVAVRCATRDHLPMIGAVPDYQQTLDAYAMLQQQKFSPETVSTAPDYPGLYLIGALGSRGLCTAPLLAELLAAQISGEPQPISRTVLQGLQPNRFWIRKLLKGKAIGS